MRYTVCLYNRPTELAPVLQALITNKLHQVAPYVTKNKDGSAHPEYQEYRQGYGIQGRRGIEGGRSFLCKSHLDLFLLAKLLVVIRPRVVPEINRCECSR